MSERPIRDNGKLTLVTTLLPFEFDAKFLRWKVAAAVAVVFA
jgi:hypothetical protein